MVAAMERDQLTLPRLHAIARRTDRCVSMASLKAGGFKKAHVRSLERRGALYRALLGVYTLGDDVLSRTQTMRVGVLAGGEGSMLTGRTAAEYLGLLPATDHTLDVWVPPSRRARVLETELLVEDTGQPATVKLRRARSLIAESVRGMPVAPVPLILLDLAANEGGEVAWRAWKEADYLRLLDDQAVRAACKQGRPGKGVVRELLHSMPIVQTDDTDAHNKAEFALIEALLRLGVVRPRSNSPMQLDQSWYFPDLWWLHLMAVVEVDGPIHRRPRRRSEDRLRDAHMRAHGLRVMRVDRDAVLEDPEREARGVAAWLTALAPVPS